jgi:hypothetical protein
MFARPDRVQHLPAEGHPRGSTQLAEICRWLRHAGNGSDSLAADTGPVTDDGNVSPQGSLTVTGSYRQTASGALNELFGSALHVNSSATLSGALNVAINPKDPPKPGAIYTAVTFGSRTGSFTSHTAGFTLTTSAHNIQVTKQ